MSTIDTSTWNPDADLNTAIEGIPLNSDASIAQTWQALRILMAAVKGDGDTIKGLLADAVDGVLQTKIYPVGSTYFSLTDSRNPNVILGFGTWAKIEGRFLLGASSSYAADSTGGEATHALTENEMPKHYHDALRYKTPTAQKFGCNSGSLTDTSWKMPYNGGAAQDYIVTGYAGNSEAHNNMPPYLAGSLWRRTA